MASDSSGSFKYGLHKTPRFSATGLAKYVSARSAGARTTAIRDAKFPKTAMVAQYREARAALIRHLCEPGGGTDGLEAAVLRLTERSERAAKDWAANDYRNSAEALASYLRADNEMNVRRYRFGPVAPNPPPLLMGGVEVFVTPDASISLNGKVGGVLLTFAKRLVTQNSAGEQLAVSSLLMHMFAEANFASLGSPDRKLCLTLHVPAARLVEAPKMQSARRKALEDACAEAADRWSSVKPPADYDGPSLD